MAFESQRAFIGLIVVGACASHDAPRTPIETRVVETPVVDAGVTLDARGILDAWNEAHTKHDTAALLALYAPEVAFFSQTKLSGAECVKRKAAAFAASPDYAQSVHDAKLIPDGSGGTYIEFSKVSTAHGKANTYFSYLYVDDGRVVAEGDGQETPTVRFDWCVHSVPLSSAQFLGLPRDNAIGGFKVSPLEAIASTMRSSRIAALQSRLHVTRLKAVIERCPVLCASVDPRGPMADPPCENKAGAYTIAITNAATGAVVEEIEVDAMHQL